MRILVYDLRLGETTSNIKIAEYQWGKTTVLIPLEDWSKNFSSYMGGLQAYANPP
jgi:hypothetical protein